MPGILYHLAFAEEVYRYIQDKVDPVQFFAGNLIPDLASANKSITHYRVPASLEGFDVPDMEKVKKDLFDRTNSIKLGMYCHLYFDYHFIEDFLIPGIEIDSKNKVVKNRHTGKSWPEKEYRAALHRGYTEINPLLLETGFVKQETLDMLPDVLPNTGIPLYDERVPKTWRQKLNGYLAEKLPYTGEALDYEQLCSATSAIAKKFVEKELQL